MYYALKLYSLTRGVVLDVNGNIYIPTRILIFLVYTGPRTAILPWLKTLIVISTSYAYQTLSLLVASTRNVL